MLSLFAKRKVIKNGCPGKVLKEYHTSDGEWLCAHITYDDERLPIEAVCGLDEMRRIVIPLKGEEGSQSGRADQESDWEEASMALSECRSAESTAAGEATQGEETNAAVDAVCGKEGASAESGTDAYMRSAKNKIALPPYGDSDEMYVKAPTGEWFPKSIALHPGDVKLTKWIDRTFDADAVWHVGEIVAEREDDNGVKQYLVKFKGYELNPGVDGDSTNPGDWYGEEDGIEESVLSAFHKKRRILASSNVHGNLLN